MSVSLPRAHTPSLSFILSVYLFLSVEQVYSTRYILSLFWGTSSLIEAGGHGAVWREKVKDPPFSTVEVPPRNSAIFFIGAQRIPEIQIN